MKWDEPDGGTRVLRSSLDASKPQEPSLMNYSAYFPSTSKTLHMSSPGYRLLWWGMRGNLTSIDTPEPVLCL